MRNIIITSFFAVSVLTSCTVSGGLGSSWICGGSSWGDPVGAQVNIEAKVLELNNSSSFKAGIGGSYQGSKYHDPGISGIERLIYLNFPLLYSYRKEKGFYGEAGFQPGFLLSAKDKYNGESHDDKASFKKFELGLPVGAGYQLKNGIGIGVRATYGITNIDNTGEEADHNLLVVGLLTYRIKSFKRSK